jgi:flagellar protein FliS
VNPSVAQKYRNNQITSSTPQETVLLLYDGVINFLKSAAQELKENKDISRKVKFIEKAIHIIDYLQLSLDMEKGGEIAKNLDRLYEYMVIRLTEANLKNDGDKIDEIVKLLLNLREGWAGICQGQGTGPLTRHPQPAAGSCQVKA